MSVINQMLKDLEQRRLQGFDNDADMLGDLDAGSAANDSPVRKQTGLWLILSVLFVLLVILVWLLIGDRWQQKPAALAETKPTQLITPIQPVEEQPAPKTVVEEEVESVAVNPIEVSEVAVVEEIQQQEITPVKVVEPEPLIIEPIRIAAINPSPLVATGKREVLTVQGSGFVEPLRVTVEWDGGRAFKELQPWQVKVISPGEIQLHVNLGKREDDWRIFVKHEDSGRQADFKFIVSAAKDEKIEAPESTIAKTSPTERANSKLAAKAENNFSKQEHVLSKDDQVRVAYAKASNLLQQGATGKAKQSLQQVLLLDAGHLQARQTLAALLFREQAYDEAIKVLELGRIQHPKYAPFTLLLARIHAERGNDSLAIDLLEQLQPAVFANSDYYALQAALYQRGAQYEKAAGVYQKLLRSYPDKAVWWMGLGLSLQSSKQDSDAVNAYNNALKAQGLTVELRRFIRSQISQLNG